MAWTTPRTWVTNELVTAAMLNTHLRDNLNYLLAPNYFKRVSTSTYTTTSSSYTSVHADFSFTLDTYGGHFAMFYSGNMITSVGGGVIDLAFAYDGGNEQLFWRQNSASQRVSGSVALPSLAAGSHTFSLRWRIASGTATMRGSDDGGAGIAYPAIIFWGIEL